MNANKIEYRKPNSTGESKIIERLKNKYVALSGLRRTIKFSDYTDISIENGCLDIHIGHKGDVYPVTENMQTDGTAFEGWAICLKSWLPEEINEVRLTWDKPQAKSLHYNRFLYRVWRFAQMYSWFGYEDQIGDIESFQNQFKGSKNNSGNKEPGMKEKECEEQVEHYMVKNNQNTFISQFGIENLNRHLPVGIKDKCGYSLFTGRNSAIDLWGIGNNGILNVFELKYIKRGATSKNIKVGIVSELLLYVNIMNDIKDGIIGIPQNIASKTEKELYNRITDLKGIKGIFLTNELHPLLEFGITLKLLNNNKKNISFEFTDYSWDTEKRKVSFK